MKLDPTVMRTMSKEDYRVLEAVELGMKDHEIVPIPLITSIANLRYGGVTKRMQSLLRDKLLSHEKFNGYDGYRITNSGYDILALHHLKCRNIVAAIGQRIGTGKESDIYLASDPQGCQMVLKFHRLGRTSFRNVKSKRDYFSFSNNNKRQQPGTSSAAATSVHSWLFLSRLSAIREYAFMKALYDVHYPTPEPLGHNRHVIAMKLIRGVPLYQIFPKQLSTEQAADIYKQSIAIATKLASIHGLVHCDLNEFNLLIDLSGIQHRATDDTADPYVRNSGQASITSAKTTITNTVANGFGVLSRPLPWMKEECVFEGDDADGDGVNIAQQRQKQQDAMVRKENGGNDDVPVSEVVPEPVAYLENGQPKPVVTLIDFPQMISIQHPNAKEYYERDIQCIQRFFIKKLQCTIPTDDYYDNDTKVITNWDDIMMLQQQQEPSDPVPSNESNDDDANNNDTNDDTTERQQSQSKSGLNRRLDEELRASGYYTGGLNRDLELFYFQSGPKPVPTTIDSDDDNDNSNNDDDDESTNEEDNNDVEKVEDVLERDKTSKNSNEIDIIDSDDDDKNEDNNNIVILDKLDMLSIATSQRSKMTLTRDEMIQIAKQRVKKQLDDEKRKNKLRSAFKKRNNNKASTKGKQILTESGY